MTTGTSKFGFETNEDRERRKLMESHKERALEARKRAREQKAIDLARLLDPVIQEVLADFLTACNRTHLSIDWDGETTWLVGPDSRSSGERFAQIEVEANLDGAYLEVISGELPRPIFPSRDGEIYESSGRIGALKSSLSEITSLPVRLFRPGTYVRSNPWSFVTRGSSRYGFETREDREQKQREALEREKELEEAERAQKAAELQRDKAQEEESRARELETEHLAQKLDPVIRDILTDFLDAYRIPEASVGWDEKATWQIHDGDQETSPIIEIQLRSGWEAIHLGLSKASRYTWGQDDDAAKATEEGSIRRLVEVLKEFTQLPVHP